MKKTKIIGVFIIFLLAFISHFLYKWVPNIVFSILFPVNESIWEHMKLIVTPVLIFSIFEYFYYRKKNIKMNNFLLSYGISSFVGIVVYLLMYIPLDNIFGYKPYIAISLLFIIYILIQFISYYIINSKNIKYSNIIGLFIILFMYIIFGYFTYFPLYISLFYDIQSKGYGIIKK